MSTQQQALHRKAINAFAELQEIVDELKTLGDCALDGDNALLNIRERAEAIARRTGQGD